MFSACDLYQVPATEYQRLTVTPETTDESAPAYSAEAFKAAVFQRLFAINVPAKSKESVQGLISKLQNVLEGITLQNAGGMFDDCMVDTFCLVGQYQKDVVISGSRELLGDMVVTLKSMPTEVSVNALAIKILADLSKNYPAEDYGFLLAETGLKISSSSGAVVTLHIATTSENLELLSDTEKAPPNALPLEQLENSLRLIDESSWFSANASSTNIKGLVRLLADLRERIPTLNVLKDPAIDLLAHFCATATADGTILPIEIAFRRFLELVGTGTLLRDSWPATDIFPSGDVDTATKMTITMQISELLCQLSMGQFKAALAV
ncbi:hypothetical protein RvY_09863 [Ramazzottius varieornatus]|uniref:DZF domain-containing protein n=1 Tax=Ramazzottius varieornatus TaxID=947166 RepID=A0A1D1VD65_RAMVA|nr:hypothetical protein RvY_09863 [Ramazzottius varieornatus]